MRFRDFRLGKLLDDLRSAGSYGKSFIIPTADYGQEFRENGLLLHRQTHDETARVPLLAKIAGNHAGVRHSTDSTTSSTCSQPFLKRLA